MANNNIFIQFPDCLSSRTKLRGVLSDFFPTEKVKINLILNAYDEGIADEIKNTKELTSLMFDRWKKIVIDNYGISEENAHWVIDYWFSEYGLAVCQKPYNHPVSKRPAKSQKNASVQEKATLSAEAFLDLSKMAKGEKFPKSRVEIYTSLDPGVEFTSLTCSIRKDYERSGITALKCSGEYSGTSDKQVLIFLMLYNANNELIGYNAATKIYPGFNGHDFFSQKIFVPSDEFISRMVVRLVYDPTSV